MKKVAFIPARSGSKRVKDKNIRDFNGKPLIAHSIESALESSLFDSVICATDSQEYADIAMSYGANVPFLRNNDSSDDNSPDISWVKYMLEKLKEERGEKYDIFSILRPTSPFRTASTIRRAWSTFKENEQRFDSLRAVEKTSQHPGKMWTIDNMHLNPLLPFYRNNVPWHSSQSCSLPEVFVQNASLEISHVKNVFEKNTITGNTIMAFLTVDFEGFDINTELDFSFGEYLAKMHQATTV